MFSAKVVIFLASLAICYGAPNAKLSSKKLKISPGVDVKIEDYPFVASVQWCNRIYGICENICGGVIVNENWILTSASCAFEARKVIVGESDLNAKHKVIVNVAAKYKHPNFTNKFGPNDLVLLKLSEALTFNDKVQPAKLPTKGQEFSGTAVVTGYGDPYLLDLNNLKAVPNVTLISNAECNKAIKQLNLDKDVSLDDDSNICTLNEAATTCLGDSGGPLSQDGTVIGTVTWYVDPCYLSRGPNVYTKLSNFVEWIEKTIAKNS
ncbi:unnamed protein product [Psylliodes chrysocephalus]|uniref:Peptidase S1 domain-containing protein n=1 Tax=Psylliodes chrysocephalus TaxID=3402493 RepID=A0A9P0CF34_9CUCU|nr:unnamed protein product [Psylliodes chrysocephala]